ncbi:MAG TPA: cell envelope integrity EipB family protein [Xanthobacteraceae bacterium]|nr:cell envelope integrity EipB family protein [Xanthobacteraceae bacterium]
MATVGYSLSTRLSALATAGIGVATLGVVALGVATAGPARAESDAPIALAPHRAIYDLKLADTHKRSLEAVRGRIVYDFSGNACEGYELRFRQVTELDSGEGKAAVSDLRSTTWEDGQAKNFRFASQNYLNDDIVDQVDGRAERQPDGVTVDLTKPEAKKADLGDVVFPAEHMRRVIAFARAGKTILELPIFDGSETGEKVYNTLTVIGHKLASDDKTPADPTASEKTLAGMARWPVTISYFDKGKTASGEQTPVYSIHFELLENGISRAVSLDYGDFSIAGEMTSLELKDVKPCK